MADPSKNTSGRSWARRAGSELIDRMFLANRGHDYQSGYWNKDGAIQGGTISAAGAINPGLGLLARWYWSRRNRNQAGQSPMGLNMTQLDPVQRMQFQPGNYSTNSPLANLALNQSPTFNPNNPFNMPQQPSNPAPSGPNWGPFTPNVQPAATGFRSLVPANGGGARGAHGMFGGTSLYGEAAQNFLRDSRIGPQSFNFDSSERLA